QFAQTVTPGTTTAPALKPLAAYNFGPSITLSTTLKSTAPLSFPFSGTASIVDAASNIIGTATVSGTGAVKFVLAGVTASNYTCTLVYGGDATHTAATSSAFSLVVNPATTTTTLVVSVANPVFGQPITLTARVNTVGTSTNRSGTV